jgi:uncharacterized membrane protein
VAVALLASRVAFSGSRTYLFLIWNLVLAWVPLVAASVLARVPPARAHWPKLLGIAAVWLVFLPNAPYLVTDLLHLGNSPAAPKWFDATMLFAFACAGCVVGFSSLSAVHARVDEAIGRGGGWVFVVAVSGLSAFGVYLGRFKRWNSWDVVSDPQALLRDVARVVLHPCDHPPMLAFTAQFASLLLIGYAMFSQRLRWHQ